MAERLGDLVLQNLVVTITNVHLRFEDIPPEPLTSADDAAACAVGAGGASSGTAQSTPTSSALLGPLQSALYRSSMSSSAVAT